MSFLCILEINPLLVVSFAIIFSHSEGCLLILFIVLVIFLMMSFKAQQLLILIKYHSSIFYFVVVLLVSCLRNHYLIQGQEDIGLYFFPTVLQLLLSYFSLEVNFKS